MLTPSDVVSELQRTIEAAGPVCPSGLMPELNYDEREQLKAMLLYVREAADDLGCALPHTAPMGHLAAALDAAAHGHSAPVTPFTAGELDVLSAALGGLAGLVEGIGGPEIVRELRRLRLKAANMHVQEVGSDV